MLRNTNAALDIRARRSGSDPWPGRARHTVIQDDLTIIGAKKEGRRYRATAPSGMLWKHSEDGATGYGQQPCMR